MCVFGWAYELISNTFVLIAPILTFRFGLQNTYFVDPITMFVIIPFLYLFNDDDTKAIIYDDRQVEVLSNNPISYKQANTSPAISR